MERSLCKVVHDRIAAILLQGAARLRGDGPAVTVVKSLPPAAATVRRPLVVVAYPDEVETEATDAQNERRVVAVPISLIVNAPGDIARMHEAEEALTLLEERVRAELKRYQNLAMADLCVFESASTWERSEQRAVTNGLERPCTLRVHTWVEQGRQWT